MHIVPSSVGRLTGRTIFKLKYHSPTILVVSGVVGLGAAAVLAARSTRDLDPIMDNHAKQRAELGQPVVRTREYNHDLYRLYMNTGWELTKLYTPALIVGTASAVAVLGGHKILRTRHMAALTAYSSLFEQFTDYRGRVARTLGADVEKGIYEGAHGELEKGSDGKEHLVPVFESQVGGSFERPWFTAETSPNWKPEPEINYMQLKGTQTHMNNILKYRGHVFVNDVLDALGMERRPEGQVTGWIYKNPDPKSDGHIDFGFMTGIDPQTQAFRGGYSPDVQLNFNHEGEIWRKI